MTSALTPPQHTRRRTGRVAIAVVALLLATTACSDDTKGKGEAGKKGDKSSVKETPPPAKVTITPAAGSTNVAPVTPISVDLERGELRTVEVASPRGTVEGTVEPGGRRWTSKGKLAFGATYTVKVTTSEESEPRTVGEFSTPPTPSGSKSVRASSILGDGKTYGIGMPIILKLTTGLTSSEQRAAFERTLSVKATPATAGAWGWINSKEVHFRPKEFWVTGSKVHVSVDSAGHDLGGKWGRSDLTVDFTIGERRELRADSKTHQMKVLENGAVVRTIPISLGKPKFPSNSGTMVVIDKRPEALFDSSTYGLAVTDPDGYQTKVQYPIRLSWGGQFIHSAPWSVNSQGKVNVSHGCINVAPANAVWLYNRIRVGDPVTVVNTERTVKIDDGWAAWSVPFNTWLKKSATGEQQAA